MRDRNKLTFQNASSPAAGQFGWHTFQVHLTPVFLTCPWAHFSFLAKQSPLHNCRFRGNHISLLPHHSHQAVLTADLSMTVFFVSESSTARLVPRAQQAHTLSVSLSFLPPFLKTTQLFVSQISSYLISPFSYYEQLTPNQVANSWVPFHFSST